MKKFVLLLNLIFSVCLLSYSANIEWKSGYVVTASGDTIRGTIAYQDGEKGDKCLFRAGNEVISRTYTPTELKMYMYDSGLCYESLEIDNPKFKGTFFVECLLKGQLSLYYANVEAKVDLDSVSSYIRYIVINDIDKKRIEITPIEEHSSRVIGLARTRKTLEVLLAGYPELKDELKNTNGYRRSLIDLFEKYNDWICNEERCIVYTEPSRVNHFWITPYAGVQLNIINYQDLYGYVYYTTNFTPVVGAVFTLNIDKFTNRWLFNIGVSASMRKMNANKRGQFFKFESYHVQNHFSVEYRWMKKVAPLLEAGLFQVGTICTENEIKYSDFHRPAEFGYRKCTFGILVGAGLALPVGKHNAIPIKVQYSKALLGKLIPDRLIESDMLSLSVGYTFSLK